MNKLKAFVIRFKNEIVKFVKGMAIGVACIVPGVSGGTLAVLLNIYDEMLEAIGSITKHFKKSFITLLPIFLGVLAGIIALILPINWGLENYPFATVTLFIGLIIGGLPSLYRKVSSKKTPLNFTLIFISLTVVVLLCLAKPTVVISLSNPEWYMYLLLVVVGVLASAALVVPGISGSMLLLLIGFYEPIMAVLKELMHFDNLGSNVLLLVPFALGILLGFVLMSKLISFCLKKWPIATYYCIIGFILGSLFGIYYAINDQLFNREIGEYVVSIFLLAVGIGISLFVGKYGEKENQANIKQKQLETEEN